MTDKDMMLQVMALDESCLACGPGEQDQGPVMSREARDEAFTRNYKRYVFPSDSSEKCKNIRQ